MPKITLEPLPPGAVTVNEAARQLGCSVATVRRLLDRSELTGHRIGIRGVRVDQTSIDDYRRRHALRGTGETLPAPRPPSRQATASREHREACARLRELGLLPDEKAVGVSVTTGAPMRRRRRRADGTRPAAARGSD